jgi:hypothetical protein
VQPISQTAEMTETDSQRAGTAWLPAGLGPALAMIGLCAGALAALELSIVLAGGAGGVSDAVAALPALAGLIYVGAGLVAWARSTSQPDGAASRGGRSRLDVRRLAELDGARAPSGRLLVAEADGELVAAVPLAGGPAIADPFRHTTAIVSLLGLRAAQLRGVAHRRTTGRQRRRALASAGGAAAEPTPAGWLARPML